MGDYQRIQQEYVDVDWDALGGVGSGGEGGRAMTQFGGNRMQGNNGECHSNRVRPVCALIYRLFP